MKPDYAENIIVGVRTASSFDWFVTEKEDWILDINKYFNARLSAGFNIDQDFILACRNGVSIIDSSNISEYINSTLSDCRVTKDQLRDLLIEASGSEEVLAMVPNLYIDFVEKKLISQYPEIFSFEKYVPDEWQGEYNDFLNKVGDGDKYWMLNEKNLLQAKLNESEEQHV